jgi:hypothetical protein
MSAAAATLSLANNSQTVTTCPDNNQAACVYASLQFTLGSQMLTLTADDSQGTSFEPFVSTPTGTANDVWWGPFAANNMGTGVQTDCTSTAPCNGVGSTNATAGGEPIQGNNTSVFDFLNFDFSAGVLPDMTLTLLGYNSTSTCNGASKNCPNGTGNDADNINIWIIYQGASAPIEYSNIASVNGAITGSTINFNAFATGAIKKFAIQANDGSFMVASMTGNLAVPEPTTMVTLGTGLLGLVWLGRRRRS